MSGTLIIPGDTIELGTESGETSIGPGITTNPKDQSIVYPSTAGLLKSISKRNKTIAYIEHNTKRYIPTIHDYVVGVVITVFGDGYRVSLANYSQPVVLSALGFPNATKKNRPHLKVGDVVYAIVSLVDRDVEVEIECIDPVTGKEGGFGQLNGGTLFDVKLAYARYLLFNSNAEILEAIVNKCQFEIAIGSNGKIWINTENVKTTVAAMNAIVESQQWKKEEIVKNVNKIFKDVL
ncbi:unnamed protein product [Kuraishia capsulata CBS 1993]|uniref:Ribosomal RNA-processing protein 40 n=1 Tax=Kuraishia capsulata CBS 1993 TaxID=1382522 RepID=W6MUJ9_9ASCO|nr:uncharacterized protein KUCA_T00005330001 [Kuraishia capsulata CBS 1993]CDK29342.1 unnamed protein product [Kuraishia capsulata CBS 1993]